MADLLVRDEPALTTSFLWKSLTPRAFLLREGISHKLGVIAVIHGERSSMPMPLPLSALEKAWRAHPLGRDRGAGGRRSLTGFSYQLALSLDQLLTAAFSGSPPTELLFDSLGDLTRLSDGAAYLIQVKSTLTADRARDAAREALDVDAFLAEKFPGLRDGFRFSVWCRRREGKLEPREITAAALGLSGNDSERWLRLRERLLPVEIRPDPHLLIVLRLFPYAEAPFALADALLGTLLRLLGEDIASDQIALEILRLIQDQRRRVDSEPVPPGRLLVPQDFVPTASEKNHVLVGDRPRLKDLLDGCFMPRLGRVHSVIEKIASLLESSAEDAGIHRALPVVWLDGTSGSGKSVLLLQTLEYLVVERGIPVHLLPPASQRLPEVLTFLNWADRPVVIAADDLFAPENREGEVWRRVYELSFDGHWTVPPVILTCGPLEYRQQFEAEVRRSGGIELVPVALGALDSAERTDYSSWYSRRTGYPVQQIAEENFATAAFLYGLQREGETADLGQFAQRLGDRLTGRGVLDEVLAVMLGTSLGFPLPASLFTGKEDACESLVQERLLRWGAVEDDSKVLTFLHPSIASKTFDYLVPAAEIHKRASYLVQCFLTIRSKPARAQAFIRLLASLRLSQRESRLTLEKIWPLLAQREPPDIELSLVWAWRETATDLATHKAIQNALERISRWLESPGLDPVGLAMLWQILWDGSQPTPSEALVCSGREWLQRHLDAGPWNYVWQRLWKSGEQDDEMAELGEVWLELNPSQLGWNYVFRLLVDSGRQNATLGRIALLGLRFSPVTSADPYLWPKVQVLQADAEVFLEELIGRLCRCKIPRVQRKGGTFVYSLCQSQDYVDLVVKALEKAMVQELPAVAYTWQALVDSFLPTLSPRLRAVGWTWLSGREDRADWTHVWRSLLKSSPSEEDTEGLRDLGRTWLSGREDRADWNYVWQRLLELSTSRADTEELRGLGRTWLSGREDRDDWTHVWRWLLEKSPSLKDAEELRGLGRTWLPGRKDRADWTHVWRWLLDRSPSRENTEELRRLGRSWLTGREDRADWNYVWQRLLKLSTSWEDTEELHGLGRTWLSGRDDRDDWMHVWRRLLELSTSLENTKELRGLGRTWLSGREDRDDWTHVWRALLELSPSLEDSEELCGLGRTWLVGREDRADWAFVLERLIETVPEEQVEELYRIGCEWLPGREERLEWNHLWRFLAVRRPADSILISMGRRWLSFERPIHAAKAVRARLIKLEALSDKARDGVG